MSNTASGSHSGKNVPQWLAWPSLRDLRERLLTFARVRWVLAAMTLMYAFALLELEIYGPVLLGVPRPLFLLMLPAFILAYNLGVIMLARHEGSLRLAIALGLVGDLVAITVGLNGTGGVASWMWVAYPLVTIEAAFLTESPRWTLVTACVGMLLFGLDMVLEDTAVLRPVLTPLTVAENQLPTRYWVLKTTWVGLMCASAAVAGLLALRVMREAQLALEKAYSRLDEQYEALRQLDKLKSNFLSVVSHELRSPLAVIQGYTELVEEDEGLSAESRRFLGQAEEGVWHLSNKIDQMLAYTKLASGEQGLSPGDYSAEEVAEQVMALAASNCRRAGLVLLKEPVPDVCLRVDAARLEEALAGLLRNACQATDAGGTVGLKVQPRDGGMAFEVWDTGPGLPEAVVSRLGQPFVQSSLKLSEHAPGLGLGLAYAQLVASLHGGKLEVETRDGGGALVSLWLPQECRLPSACVLHGRAQTQESPRA